jgi:putative radical SAM enzyme (TIGR03279 family)
MKNNNEKYGGVEIQEVQKDSIAAMAVLMPGDKLIEVNSCKINDVIDFMFCCSENKLGLLVQRGNKKFSLNVNVESQGNLSGSASLGISLKPFKIRTCRNKCMFCFVSQLPKGLRIPLYIKDDDYRMSFLHGNYITMTNLSIADRKRIVEQRLSPLYISVHSSNIEIRNKLLGNPKAVDILKEIKFLFDNRIRMHTQIVLCPGYNDGRDLKKTIADLYRFYPYIMSIAVVPVGLTVHREKAIRPVEQKDAIEAIETIKKFQIRFKKKHGDHIVYAADELYIKAGLEFPRLEHYGDLPQIENGVGMVAQFINRARRVKIPWKYQTEEMKQQSGKVKSPGFITFTGESFYPYLKKFVDKLRGYSIDIKAAVVENTFFGRSVTVAGLITGRDVMKKLSGTVQKNDILLIPDVVMREGDEVFLDDVSRQDVEDFLGIKAVLIDSSPDGLMNAIMAHSS